ncbi:MAG: bifunctional oligoribonuclease/PAP phosphatase NrnA, partial [Candidatus Omnitrophota bacterium]
INEVVKALAGYDSFLITTHVTPEPDALGSELAVYELLRALGKKAVILNHDPVPAHYMFLAGSDIIKKRLTRKDAYDAIIVLDCPNPERAGSVGGLFRDAGCVINIDHHVSNKGFGDVQWVMPDASSTGEMIYLLFKKCGVGISKKVALYIYIAILTDTGSFNYSNTSSVTHEIVSELLGYGISPDEISSSVYENKRYEDVKLLARVLSTLTVACGGRVAYITCTRAMIRSTGSAAEATENFVNFARSVQGTMMSFFIREDSRKRNRYRVSLRSKGDVSVNRIASVFGGGGHKHAAGCTINGTIGDVKRRILKEARNEIGNLK